MPTTTLIALGILVLILVGIGITVFLFLKSVKERRAYENEELPDIFEADAEEDVLPDIEESGFSNVRNSYEDDADLPLDLLEESYSEEDR